MAIEVTPRVFNQWKRWLARRTRAHALRPAPGKRGRAASRGERSKVTGRVRGSKTMYTEKQKRQAEHIAKGYRERGVPARIAKARAWATVNRMYGGGERRGGSGYGRSVDLGPAYKGGRIGGPRGGRAAARRPAAARSRSVQRAARTRTRRRKARSRAARHAARARRLKA